MKNTMTTSLAIASFGATFAAIAFGTSAANAGVGTQLEHCASNSFGRTLNCCETIMSNAAPLTQQYLAGRTCGKSIVKVRVPKRKRIYIVRIDLPTPEVVPFSFGSDGQDRPSFGGTPDTPRGGTRGNQGGATHG